MRKDDPRQYYGEDSDDRSLSRSYGWQGGGLRERGQHFDQPGAFDDRSSSSRSAGHRGYDTENLALAAQTSRGSRSTALPNTSAAASQSASRPTRTGQNFPKGYVRSDARIQEDVCERLSDSGWDVSDVSVRVSEGRVLLEGTVDDRRIKHAIENCADDCAGVQDVENRIRVVRDMH